MGDISSFNSKALAQPIGPYSHAVVAGGFVFCSGQVAMLADGSFAGGDIEQQTRQTLTNLKTVLAEAGSSVHHVTKVTVYLKSMNDFQAMNKVYTELFEGHAPARTTIEISRLPREALVEMDAIALLKSRV